MLRPRENHSIQLEKFSLSISPGHHVHWMRDLYENNIGLLDLIEKSSDLVIEGESFVNISERNPFDFVIPSEAEEYPFVYDYENAAELAPLVSILYPRDEIRIREWLTPYWHPGKRVGTLDFLQRLNKGIYDSFKYQRRERKGVQSPAETIECNCGSCRDLLRCLSKPAAVWGWLLGSSAVTCTRPRSRVECPCTAGQRFICPGPVGLASIPAGES